MSSECCMYKYAFCALSTVGYTHEEAVFVLEKKKYIQYRLGEALCGNSMPFENIWNITIKGFGCLLELIFCSTVSPRSLT